LNLDKSSAVLCARIDGDLRRLLFLLLGCRGKARQQRHDHEWEQRSHRPLSHIRSKAKERAIVYSADGSEWPQRLGAAPGLISRALARGIAPGDAADRPSSAAQGKGGLCPRGHPATKLRRLEIALVRFGRILEVEGSILNAAIRADPARHVIGGYR
jgi:hypothetical protein